MTHTCAMPPSVPGFVPCSRQRQTKENPLAARGEDIQQVVHPSVHALVMTAIKKPPQWAVAGSRVRRRTNGATSVAALILEPQTFHRHLLYPIECLRVVFFFCHVPVLKGGLISGCGCYAKPHGCSNSINRNPLTFTI